MTFLAPTMLWSLVALAPLTAFYFLKVRPRRKQTTAYFLWERIFQERRATHLFQRLRDVLSLLLVALAASAVCLALARPEWTEQRQDLLLVVDASASMAARDGQGERMENAKALASEIVAGLNGSQRAAVATLGRELVYRSHLTDNPRELLEAIEGIAALPESVSDQALAELAKTHEEGRAHRRVLLIGDGGVVAPESDDGALDQRLELFKVGAPTENVGLVAADVAFLPDGTDRLGVYFQLASTYAETKTCDLSLTHLREDGTRQVMKVVPLELAPGVNPPERFVVEGAPPGRWLAEVDREDALAWDNKAYLIARKPPPVRVAVAAEDRFFFENSVLAFAAEQGILTLTDDNPEVVMSRGGAPDADRAIIFQPSGESSWWSEIGDEVEALAPRVLVPEHPALRHVDAGGVAYVGARRLSPPPGAQVLVADETGLPLVYAARREGRSAIVVNLDPAASDFYFSAWFPAIVHASVTHLAGREANLAASIRPGEPFPRFGAREDEAVTLVGPAALAAEESGTSLSASLPIGVGESPRLPAHLGFYTLEATGGATHLAASLLTPRETLLDDRAVDSRRPINTGSSPVRWLTLTALLVLTGESILYHRRKVG